MNDINKRQNTEEILVLLFSQRKYYNKAEIKKYAIWITTLTTFLINNLWFFKINLAEKSVVISILTIIVLVISIMLEKDIELGGTIKELIDRNLFGFPINERYLRFIKPESLEEKAYEMRDRFKKDYIIQSSNTGTDNIRGVKDWYLDVSNLPIEVAILKCQKENSWWDKKLSNIYIRILSCMIGIIFLIFLILNLNNTIKTASINLISAVPIMIMIFNEFRVYWKFKNLNTDISINLDYLDKYEDLTKDKLEELQIKIYKRRLLNFGAPNIIHQILSLKFHKIINRTTRS